MISHSIAWIKNMTIRKL